MKGQYDIWKALSLAAIGLIIVNIVAYSLLWDVPYIVFEEFVDYVLLDKLIDKYYAIVLCFIPTLLGGIVLKRIKQLKKFNISFKRGLIISILIIYSLLLINRSGYLLRNRKIKIETVDALMSDYVEYDTRKVKMYFSKSDVVEYCDNGMEETYGNEELESFKSFVLNSDSSISIKPEYVYLPDTFRLREDYENPGLFDTIQVIDQYSLVNSNIRALHYASTELLKSSKYLIFDKEKGVFVDYIYYQTIYSGIGNLDLLCYFPDGRIFVNTRLMWGL